MSAVLDYLNGEYPEYKQDNFIADLIYPVFIQKKDLRVLRMCPELHDSVLFDSFQKTINSVYGRTIEIVKDPEVSAEICFSFDSTGIEDEYIEFSEFLKQQDCSIECSKNDFQLIKLFELYQKFKRN